MVMFSTKHLNLQWQYEMGLTLRYCALLEIIKGLILLSKTVPYAADCSTMRVYEGSTA